MATGITDSDSTGMDALIPEVWARQTRDSFLPRLVMANLVDRSFEAELDGRPADTIHVDGMGGSTFDTISGFDAASNITVAAGGTLTSEVVTLNTQVDISIDTHAYKFWDLEYELDLFTQFPLLERMAKRSTFAVAQKVDDDGAGLVDNFSQNVGTLAVPLPDSDVRRAKQYLDDADVPEENRRGMTSPAQLSSWLDVEKYNNTLYRTAAITEDPNAGTYRGFVGRLYGIDWYVSNNVEGTNAAGHDSGIWHVEALALVMVDNMRTATDYEITTDSNRFAVHAIYGWKEIRDKAGVWMKGE